MADACQDTVRMSLHLESSQSAGLHQASFWQSAVMMKRYTGYIMRKLTCILPLKKPDHTVKICKRMKSIIIIIAQN